MLLLAWWRLFGGDYAVPLPNGYELVRLAGSTIVLDKPGLDCRLVGPTVDGYCVYGDIVVGHVSRDDSLRDIRPSVPGYFLVDTKQGTAFQGLGEAEWLKTLKKHGIAGKQLRKPSRWDRYRK